MIKTTLELLYLCKKNYKFLPNYIVEIKWKRLYKTYQYKSSFKKSSNVSCIQVRDVAYYVVAFCYLFNFKIPFFYYSGRILKVSFTLLFILNKKYISSILFIKEVRLEFLKSQVKIVIKSSFSHRIDIFF